jgi:spore coat polysaccharide biosynthesis predicted glycosyltransferase SpsG
LLKTYLLVKELAGKSIPFEPMRLVFRADASHEIGAGHAMRCSAIAEEALARDIDCIFVGTLGRIEWLEKRFSEIGFRVVALEDFGESQNNDVLIVDSYLLDNKDDFIAQHNWKSRVDIVDEFTPLRDADLFIHPGLESQWFGSDRSKFLFGPKFIPFRKSIKKIPAEKPKGLSKIVIFGGGTDSYGFAKAMSLELRGLAGFDKAIFFASEHRNIEELDSRFCVIAFGAELDNELIGADLVFTTASTSSIEVLARELPLGVACSVANQVGFYESLGKANVAAKIGERVTSSEWKMCSDVIRRLILDRAFRTEFKVASHGFLDLLGAQRIVEAIVGLHSGVNPAPQHR